VLDEDLECLDEGSLEDDEEEQDGLERFELRPGPVDTT
jgi:hypothetical protein